MASSEAISVLEEQIRLLKTQLTVESRKLVNARYLNESYERQTAEALMAAALSEARAHRAEAKLQHYEETQEVLERRRTMAKLAESLSDGGSELVAAEGLVRTCRSDPVIKHPVAGLSRRRELAKLQSKVDVLASRFESEKRLMKKLQDIEDSHNELWLAASQNNIKTVEMKVRVGCSVCATDEQGYSALTYGCRYGHKEVVQLCLEHGASLASNHALHVPLVIAVSHNHEEIVRILLKAGADIDGVDGSGHTALHMASEKGLLSMVNLLLEAGAAVDPLNSHGFTPLHLATQKLEMPVIKVLLAAGASPDKRDIHGRSPLDMIPSIPQTRPNVSIRDVEDNATAKQERTNIMRLLSAHMGDAIAEESSSCAESSVASLGVSKARHQGGMPAATLHLSREEQRSLTRTTTKKMETIRDRRDHPPSLDI